METHVINKSRLGTKIEIHSLVLGAGCANNLETRHVVKM